MGLLEDIKKSLEANKQSHLLMFYNELSEEQQQKYVQHLSEIDFDEMTDIFKRANNEAETEGKLIDDLMKPIPEEKFESESKSSKNQLMGYWNVGLKEISEGTVGVILMAGGQGTRLGVSHPKGMYNVGLHSNKSLFQIQAERILKVQNLANEKYNKNGKVTWYIMTSGPTFADTQKYLKENNYFGLEEKDVIIFKQGLFPCFQFDGKIYMDAKDKVALAPDGNGGIFKALKVNGILKDFKLRGVKYIHVHSVDNILIKVADPTFIGYCVQKGADCAAKVVRKTQPTEAVGVVCLVDNKFQVVEYSEIKKETSELSNKDGLLYNAGNICNHFFTADFLEMVAMQKMKLHIAKKKIPHVNANGDVIKPESPNGIKVEKFVFDVFEFSKNFVTWEVPRESEFSALKNADSAGTDCPSTARNDLFKLHKKYLKEAGAKLIGDEFEISPLVSYEGEGLEQYAGKTLESPRLIN